jgi:hypothetical protein
VAREGGGFERLPSLRPEDLGDGVYLAVVTVKEAQDNIPVNKPDGKRKFSCRVRFEEIGDRNWWPNETSRKVLYRMLGADVRAWRGKLVVLEVVQSETPPPESMPTLVVWSAEPQTWRGHIAAYQRQQAERASAEPAAPPTAPPVE